jgi:selenocysteine-specific elongation factor
VRGDAFIFRTSQGTAGGGRVLDPFPRRHRRFAANVIQALEAREHGDPARALLETLAPRQPAEAQALLERTTLAPAEGRAALESLVAQAEVVPLGGLDTNPYLFTRDGWRRLALEASEALSGYHRSLPLNAGMPKEELKSRLKLPGRAFPAALERLVKEGELAEDGSLVRLPSHQPRLTASQQAEADAFLQALEREPYAPAPEKLPDPAVLAFLTRQGRIVRLGDNVCLSAPRYEEMERKVLQQIKQRGKITVAEVRDLFQTSRKYALALMEHLAEKKLTRRVGDEHVLR